MNLNLNQTKLNFSDKNQIWLAALGLSIFIFLALVTINALSVPIYEWDAISIWGYKAKILFNSSLNPKPKFFHDLSLIYSHLDYPLLVPLLLSGFYASLGGIDDQAVKVIFVLFYLAFWFISYIGFRWKLSRNQSFCLATIIVGVPSVIRWAGTATADVPLAVYYSGSLLYLLKWIEKKNFRDWTLLVLFTAFCAFTKNEGIALALINILVMALFCNYNKRQNLFWVIAFGLSLLLLLAPYLIWNFDTPRVHENYISQIHTEIIFDGFNRLKLLVPRLASEILNLSWWGTLWIAGLSLAGIGWKAFQKNYVRAAWTLFILHITLYIFIYIITPWKISELLTYTLDRLILHTVPAMGYIIAFHWAEINGPTNS